MNLCASLEDISNSCSCINGNRICLMPKAYVENELQPSVVSRTAYIHSKQRTATAFRQFRFNDNRWQCFCFFLLLNIQVWPLLFNHNVKTGTYCLIRSFGNVSIRYSKHVFSVFHALFAHTHEYYPFADNNTWLMFKYAGNTFRVSIASSCLHWFTDFLSLSWK